MEEIIILCPDDSEPKLTRAAELEGSNLKLKLSL